MKVLYIPKIDKHVYIDLSRNTKITGCAMIKMLTQLIINKKPKKKNKEKLFNEWVKSYKPIEDYELKHINQWTQSELNKVL